MKNLQEERARTFISIKIPEEAVKEIARVQSLLSRWKFTGKIIELENLHLTLKFLGEIRGEVIDKVIEKLRMLEFKEFEVKLGEIGIFRYRNRPRIVWVKISGTGIFELQRKIDGKIKEFFLLEDRFMSHLTISRVKYVKDNLGFINYIKNIKVREIKWVVRDFFINKSELTRMGPKYTNLFRFSAV